MKSDTIFCRKIKEDLFFINLYFVLNMAKNGIKHERSDAFDVENFFYTLIYFLYDYTMYTIVYHRTYSSHLRHFR